VASDVPSTGDWPEIVELLVYWRVNDARAHRIAVEFSVLVLMCRRGRTKSPAFLFVQGCSTLSPRRAIIGTPNQHLCTKAIMKLWRKLAACAGLWATVFCLASQIYSSAQEIVTLTQLNRLGPSDEPRPLRLKGVIVCYDAGWHQLYLHDGERTSYFNADEFKTQPEVGQEVEITGLARSSNSLANLHLKILRKSELPSAIPLRLSELAREHGAWIETTGRVLSAETSRARLSLLLHDSGQNSLAYVLGAPVTNDFKRLLGTQVRVRGINASKSTGNRLDTAMIFVPRFSEITVLENGPVPRPEVPVVSIGSLLSRELGLWTNQWVHLNGLVVSYQPGQWLVVKDPTGVIRAQVVQMTEIAADERVDIWGFLHAAPQEAFLKSAWFEVVRTPGLDFANRTPFQTRATATNLPRLLTTISEVIKLPREHAAAAIPVRLRGVITAADPEWRVGFLQDQSGAIYVDLNPDQKQIQSGQWVELSGVTSAGGFAPEVLSSNIVVLGSTNLPAPARVDLEELANGHLDAHWVEMEGVVSF
jgi:hypothetical protein